MSARTRAADTPFLPRAAQGPKAAPRAPGTPATEPGARSPTDRLVLADRTPTGSRRGPQRCPPAEGTGARHMSDTITRTRRDGGGPGDHRHRYSSIDGDKRHREVRGHRRPGTSEGRGQPAAPPAGAADPACAAVDLAR